MSQVHFYNYAYLGVSGQCVSGVVFLCCLLRVSQMQGVSATAENCVMTSPCLRGSKGSAKVIDCDGGGKGGSAKVTKSYGIFSTNQILQSAK